MWSCLLPQAWAPRSGEESPQTYSVPTAFETRCPNGKKIILYKRAKLEKWAPYLNSNGLVCRLTTYEDLECTGQPGWGS